MLVNNVITSSNSTTRSVLAIIKSCCDLAHLPRYEAPSGVYQLTYNYSDGSPFTRSLLVDVYCDRGCDEEWMVIQRNVKDGVETFNKQWKAYEDGFGDLRGSKLWYGQKALNRLTQTGQWELRIDFQFENGTKSHLH